MSLKIVIVAVICIVILVVLIILFTGKTKLLSRTGASCEARGTGASCIAAGTECDGASYSFGTDCAKRFEKGESGVAGSQCCVPFESDSKKASTSSKSK